MKFNGILPDRGTRPSVLLLPRVVYSNVATSQAHDMRPLTSGRLEGRFEVLT